MSGTIARVLGAVSTAQQITSLFTGGSLTLDDMQFADFELPEQISYGSQQQITTHKFPGGGRVLDVMGDDPNAITWSGTFLGLGAEARRSKLGAIRARGEPVELSWSDQSVTVVVSECWFDENFHRIEYRVSCIVLPDVLEADDLGDGSLPTTPSAAGTAIGSALGFAGSALSAVDSIAQAGLSAVQTAGQVLGAFTAGTVPNLALGSAAVGLAGTLSSVVSQASSVINGVSVATPVGLLGAVNAAGTLARNTGALAFVSNVQTILSRP